MEHKINFNLGWKFHDGDISLDGQAWWGFLKSGTSNQGGARARLDDSNWESVDLPHDFVIHHNYTTTFHEGTRHNIEEMWSIGEYNTMRGSLKGNIAWYRKHFTIDREREGKTVYIEFEGVYRDCEIYVNDYYIGRHMSGYTGFYFDIGDFLNYGGENVIAVKVDASQYEGWYYEGGGIYRNVWLRICDKLHTANWGTFVQSEVDLNTSAAKLKIETEVLNQYNETKSFTLISKIISPEQTVAAICENQFEARSFQPQIYTQVCTLSSANLWAVEHPALYTLITELYQDDALLDSYETPFGIRDIRFDKDRGFLLNGKEVKLNGVCCHQDHAGIGVAMPDSLYVYRIKKLQEFGANAYRTAHHPAAPALLSACDAMGMLVMSENRLLSSGDEDLKQLKAMVKRDRNHPSIVIWSLGNEEGRTQFSPKGGKIACTMRQTVRTLDPTRPVTAAIVMWNWIKQEHNAIETVMHTANELDVMGFNYSDDFWTQYRGLDNQKAIVITEASSGYRTRNCYDNEQDKYLVNSLPETENAEVNMERAENELEAVQTTPYVCGSFIWTGFDYYGEPVPYQWPAVSSQFGMLDLLGIPKDTAYYYKCWWTSEPMIHIGQNWTKPDNGQKVTVFVYTNCEEAELFLNGNSLGKKAVKKYHHLIWEDISYQPGTLSAKGYCNSDCCAQDCLSTAGSPYALSISADRLTLTGDGQDSTVITVSVIDQHGNVVPYANNLVTFSIEGNGTMTGIANGDPKGHSPKNVPYTDCFNGYCQCVIRSGRDGNSEITVTASSPMLKQDKVTIKTI